MERAFATWEGWQKFYLSLKMASQSDIGRPVAAKKPACTARPMRMPNPIDCSFSSDLYLNFDRTASNADAALATEAMAEIKANFHNLDSLIDRSASITRL
jgi:hypothetical protein